MMVMSVHDVSHELTWGVEMISPRGIRFTGMSDADNVVSNCEVMRETEKQFSPGETGGRGRDHMTVSSPGHWPLLYS